jgi:hypothetical protein
VSPRKRNDEKGEGAAVDVTDDELSDEESVPRGEQTPPDTQAQTSLGPSEKDQATPGVISGGLTEEELEVARERVEGRTSDAASRTEDQRAADVPADRFVSVKASDAGPDQYPFPPQGDVDIATVPVEEHDGEVIPPIPVGAWVRLGSSDNVPERFWGHLAAVVESPTFLTNGDLAPRTYETQPDDVTIVVKTRDEADALLRIEKGDIAAFSPDRAGLVSVA